MRRSFSIVCALAAFLSIGVAERRADAVDPVTLILDTDIENDVDDVGAVALLHALADLGEAKILAMGVSVKHPWSAPCLDVLNTYYGRPDIPIGVVKGAGVDTGSKYAKTIAAEFPHKLRSADDAPDAVALYRKVLAAQADQSTVLVSIGFLSNIANLVESPADAVSDLSGLELVRKKVRLWVCMGGQFPQGREWNLFQDTAASRRALEKWPTPIVFSGFEIGESIQTGAALKDAAVGGPVRRSYELFNGLHNRASWDQTAVLYAVRGGRDDATGYWSLHRPGTIQVLADGANRWQDSAEGKHTYLVRKIPDAQLRGRSMP
jgi:hypothetical protein